MRANQLDTALIAELLGESPSKEDLETQTPIVEDSLQSRIDATRARIKALGDRIEATPIKEEIQRFERMPIPSENKVSTSDIEECECDKGFDIIRFASMAMQSFLHIGLLSLLIVYGTIGICICNLLLQIAMCL
tara:strand:+ start:12616 stop:13017 length:402 start_codon:yes stop_codon:yes gene_type:complete